MKDEEYLDLVLDGTAMTEPVEGRFYNSDKTNEITMTCAMGAARYAFAVQTNSSEAHCFTAPPNGLYEKEIDVCYRFLEKYGLDLGSYNDNYGRENAVLKIKEMFNDSQ
jgi:hypothetical protein